MEPHYSVCSVCSRRFPPDSGVNVCAACVQTEGLRGPVPTPLPYERGTPAACLHPTPELPPTPLPILPRMDVIRCLGIGGMGTVYLAIEADTRRPVAVKVLRSASDPVAADRFQAEVRAITTLRHPNIVTVYSADLGHDPPYFTMEYVPGGTLTQRVIARGPLTPWDAAALLALLARATHTAHRRNIVHRDIKSGNVLIADTTAEIGTADSSLQSAIRNPQSAIPKLSDFGLVKRIDRDDEFTLVPGAIGTPGFMAPEQAAGEEVSPRTDVYGLGATLYFALTGRPPLDSRAREQEPPPIRSVQRHVPRDLAAVVHKCLEPDPDDRYATAAELADDLERFARGEPVTARPPGVLRLARRILWRNRGRLTRAACLVVALAGAVILGAGTNRSLPAAASGPPAADPLLEMQGELTAGRPVTLVGATGAPRWHNWATGPCTLPGTADEACSFRAFNAAMLDLCPDPMTDRYRIRAEIRQLDVNGRTPDGRLPTGGVFDCGLYFGRQSADGKKGWHTETCLAVRFTEAPAGAAGNAKFGRVVVTSQRGRRPDVSEMNLAGVPFAPAVKLPSPWRVIEAEVTPEGVRAWLGLPDGTRTEFAPLKIVAIRRHYVAPHGLDRVDPGHEVVAPVWNPRGAIGVWSFSSAVAVRNVTVVPLNK